MGLETFGNIDDLVSTNPVDNTDTVASMGAHIRGIKSTLQTDFPNITGAVTSTQAELNILDGQIGGFILAGNSTGGGTANAITADFTPNISLTDGVTVIVRAQGANTSTTPTFNPDSLGAKTIVKNSNSALAVGDIAGASHELILKYNSTNDNWTLLNAAQESFPAAVSGFDRCKTINLKDDTIHGVVSISHTDSTWESYGPTGSGATNIDTDLNIIPSTATHLIAYGHFSGTHSSSTFRSVSLAAREPSGSSSISIIVESAVYCPSASAWTKSTGILFIPLDSNNTFEAYVASNFDTAKVYSLTIVGWAE